MDNQQKLNDREEVKAKIADNSAQIDVLTNRLDKLHRERNELANSHEGMMRRADRNHTGSGPEKQRLEQVIEDIEHTQARIGELQLSIDTDTATLNAFSIAVSTKEIIEQQTAIQEDLKKAENLERFRAEQQAILDAAQCIVDTALPLKKRRGQLLAESATGVDNTKHLAEIDDEIIKAETTDSVTNQAKKDEAGKASETLEALNDMLANLRQTIATKQHMLNLLQDCFIHQIAVNEAEKYKEAAKQVADSLRTLAAIDSIIGHFGIRKRSGALPKTPQQAVLPSLDDMPKNNGELFLWTNTAQADQEGIDALISRLKSQGINLAYEH